MSYGLCTPLVDLPYLEQIHIIAAVQLNESGQEYIDINPAY